MNAPLRLSAALFALLVSGSASRAAVAIHVAPATTRTTEAKWDLLAKAASPVLRGGDWASLYRWAADAAKHRELAQLALKRGSTVSGHGDTGNRKLDPNEITVTLEPLATTHPNKRGFFSFD